MIFFRSLLLKMKKLRFFEAASQVFWSVFLGMGLILASALSALETFSISDWTQEFLKYFSGGELGLPIAATCGSVFHILLTKFGALSSKVSVTYGVLIFSPLVLTFLFVGSNPGFRNGGLADFKITILWGLYVLINLTWYFLLLDEGGDGGVDPLEKATDEQDAVERILGGKRL